MDKRKIIFGIIIFICIVSVNVSIYEQFFKVPKEDSNVTPVVEEAKVIQDFNSIFKNKIDYQNYDIQGLSKKDNTKDMIYTEYEKQEKKENTYELNVNIPHVNINSIAAETINNEIDNLFKTKATNTLIGNAEKTIYTVEYQAYINYNILSIVIKSTLKEADMPQRVIVKTYVYNLSTNEVLTLPKVLEIKNLAIDGVEKEIKNKIEDANAQAQKLKELGYDVYTRDVHNSIYEVENTANFFLGQNQTLYILYPYGNSNKTSEIDIILFE